MHGQKNMKSSSCYVLSSVLQRYFKYDHFTKFNCEFFEISLKKKETLSVVSTTLLIAER